MVNTMLAVTAQQGPAVWFVCLLGVGVVFVGLTCIIGIISLMNVIFASTGKKNKQKQETVAQTETIPAVNKTETIENRQEILAAVCAAVAEENGTDISAIRVVSFKKI